MRIKAISFVNDVIMWDSELYSPQKKKNPRYTQIYEHLPLANTPKLLLPPAHTHKAPYSVTPW